MAAALDGDKDAFAGLVTRHWATALALAARLLGPGDLARDAVQEASVTALIGLDRLRSAERFGAWFCGITLNVARRWLRQLHAEVPAVLPDRASGSPGPDERAELAELAAEVRAAVAQLPEGQRQAVWLFYLQGLTRSHVTEVRVTRLAGPVFYAMVVIDGPAGRHEVDARPSDAVNLALVTGALVRVSRTLLDDLTAQGHVTSWEDFPPSTAELAAEARERMLRLRR